MTGQEETCLKCGQPYALGIGVRCFDCDREFCPVCIVWIETGRACTECSAPENETRGSSA